MSNNIPAELKYVASHEWLRLESLPSTKICQALRKLPTATLTAQAGSSKSNLPILPITTVC